MCLLRVTRLPVAVRVDPSCVSISSAHCTASHARIMTTRLFSLAATNCFLSSCDMGHAGEHDCEHWRLLGTIDS